MERKVMDPLTSLTILQKQTSDKVNTIMKKLETIEKHLPTMIQEILDYYFSRKIEEVKSTYIDKQTFRMELLKKTDNNVFMNFYNKICTDRQFIENYLKLETKLHQTDR
jgi:hypothetical protein